MSSRIPTIISDRPIDIEIVRPWRYSVKVSNDNTKGERRVTIHVYGDDDLVGLQKRAVEQYLNALGNNEENKNADGKEI